MGALPPQELINAALPHFWSWEPCIDSVDLRAQGRWVFWNRRKPLGVLLLLGIPVVLLAGWATLFLKQTRVWKVIAIGALCCRLVG